MHSRICVAAMALNGAIITNAMAAAAVVATAALAIAFSTYGNFPEDFIFMRLILG